MFCVLVILSCFVFCRVCSCFVFFFSSRRRHTRYIGDWSSDVCSSDLRAMTALPAPVPNVATDPGWRLGLPLVVGALAAVLAIHWRTVEAIVAIWARSETLAHGFLIVPIVLVLIWQRRHALAARAPRPDALGLVLLGCAGAVWLVAYAGEVLVVKQLALVATIWATVIAILGREVAKAITFPVGFLVLGVPMGEALIPPLMDWTADFTVTALQLSGIPVFREGMFFTIPSGNWSIVE